MTVIYLIRHAQAEGNLYRMMQGHWDGGVTDLGRAQIACLAERFKDEKVDKVYSSDLFRTRLTASAVLKYNNVPIILDKRLREINVGPWEGEFFGNVSYKSPELMDKFMNDPANWQLDGAETYADVQKRAMEVMRDIGEENDGLTVAASSHGVTISTILAAITGRPYNGENRVPICGNTAVCKIVYENGEFTLDYENDTSHLDAMSATRWSWNGVLRSESFDPRSDKEYYKACYRDAWIAAHGSSYGYNPSPYYQSALEHYLRNKDSIMRLWVGEEKAGIIDLDPARGAEEGIGWISLLYLSPEFRHKGFGIQLLGRAYFFFEKLGRDKIRLHVAEDNVNAVKFYKKWGFEVISTDPGTTGVLYLMEKKLGTERL